MTDDVPDIVFTDHPLNLLYKPKEFWEWSEEVGGSDVAVRLLGEALEPYQREHGDDALIVMLWKLTHVDAYLNERSEVP
jgi:hypothetical protein